MNWYKQAIDNKQPSFSQGIINGNIQQSGNLPSQKQSVPHYDPSPAMLAIFSSLSEEQINYLYNLALQGNLFPTRLKVPAFKEDLDKGEKGELNQQEKIHCLAINAEKDAGLNPQQAEEIINRKLEIKYGLV